MLNQESVTNTVNLQERARFLVSLCSSPSHPGGMDKVISEAALIKSSQSEDAIVTLLAEALFRLAVKTSHLLEWQDNLNTEIRRLSDESYPLEGEADCNDRTQAYTKFVRSLGVTKYPSEIPATFMEIYRNLEAASRKTWTSWSGKIITLYEKYKPFLSVIEIGSRTSARDHREANSRFINEKEIFTEPELRRIAVYLTAEALGISLNTALTRVNHAKLLPEIVSPDESLISTLKKYQIR